MTPIYVVIPAYNAEKYIAQAVSSVVAQSYEDIRIVLVNDGSTDNTPNICDALARKYASISVIHQENAGVSCARNAGIDYILQENSQNAYIAFLDADDFWHPSFLQQDTRKILEPQYDIYAFGTVNCDEKACLFSTPILYDECIHCGGNSAMWLLKGHFAANLYHVSLFKNWGIRFFAGFKYSEDKYFKVLCSFFANKIAFCAQTMYIYRESSGGAMSRLSQIGAVDYFAPIIDGWLQVQHVINQHSDVTGVTSNLGYQLGNVYLLDMICEHYMQQGSRSEINKFVRQHPNYQYLQNMKSCGDKDVNFKKKCLYFEHPCIFAVKYRVKGMLRTTVRMAFQLPFVRNINNRRKYPLKCLP